MEIAVFTDRPAIFWTAMGPHFASKAIRRDLPALCDAPGYVWFLAFDELAQLVAFASVDIDTKRVGHLRNLYVLPQHRGTGVASALMDARLDYLRGQEIQIARTSRRVKKEIQFAENHGFQVIRTEGSWQILEADLSHPPPARPVVSPDPPEATSAQIRSSREAGAAAARKAMVARESRGLRFVKARPSRKDMATHTGESWDAFVAGWVEAVQERRDHEMRREASA